MSSRRDWFWSVKASGWMTASWLLLRSRERRLRSPEKARDSSAEILRAGGVRNAFHKTKGFRY